MPLFISTLSEGPKPTRSRRHVIEATPEWREFLATISKRELKPYEAIFITFKETNRYGLKAAARVFRDLAKKEIATRKLQYDVERFKSDGQETIRIAAPLPAAGKKPTLRRTQHAHRAAA